MIKIGLIGLGHLGKIHLKLLQEIEGFEVVGIYDVNTAVKVELANHFNLKACNSYQELLEISEAIDIVTPSVTHFELAAIALEQGKHVFIEKPVTPTVDAASKLLKLNQKNVVIQIGHVERFNPAYTSCSALLKRPHLIDFKRFAIYNPRGTDVSVTLDLMVHDIDILLDIVKFPIKKVSAYGRREISESADVAEATVEFENGCIAKLSTNRNASNNQREITVYQDNSIFNIDLLQKKTVINEFQNKNLTNHSSLNSPEKDVLIKYPNISPSNAIKDELMAFHKSITTGVKPAVTLEEAIEVLKLVQIIDEKILKQTVK